MYVWRESLLESSSWLFPPTQHAPHGAKNAIVLNNKAQFTHHIASDDLTAPTYSSSPPNPC